MDQASQSLRNDVHGQLESVICLLAFITKRLLDDEGLEALESLKDARDPDTVLSPNADDATVESSVEGDGSRMNDIDDVYEELEDVDCLLDTGTRDEQYRTELQNKVLDRLAETLARFKSSPKARAIDSKHVSSTMMIVYKDENRVEIICSKNEGLDDVDKGFLDEWQKCMQEIARKESASKDDQEAMHNLVFEHQKPRIMEYLKWLRCAFQRKDLPSSSSHNRGRRMEDLVAAQRIARYRTWSDNNGFIFHIPINWPSTPARGSDAVSIGISASEDANDLSNIIESINKLSQADIAEGTRDDALKNLMKDTFEQWKGIRTRSAIKAYLYRNFASETKKRKEAEKALIFLAKVHYSVLTFIRAAELIPTFKSVKCIPFLYARPKANHSPKAHGHHPMEFCEDLGIQVKKAGWSKMFDENAPKLDDLLNEKRQKLHFHAELQTLYYYDHVLSSKEQKRTHPYMGCSRRNCALCYLFLRAHGRFGSRGTHGSILHRWDVPEPISDNNDSYPADSSLQPGLERFIATLKFVLRELLERPCPVGNRELRAQSSKALSSAQFLVEKELMAMERSPRDIQHMLMIPTVMGDRFLITKTPSEPGKVHVVGGGNARHRERVSTMTVGEAEVLEANYTRSKFGLEPLGKEMCAPTRDDDRPGCRQCGRASGLRCSACRIKYCSKACQAKDWNKHVFVCCVKNRPNDVDNLKIIVRRWLCTQAQQDEEGLSKLLLDIYADDHLCNTFGFNYCLTQREISNLICIYNALGRSFQPAFIQSLINVQLLGQFLEDWVVKRGANEDCDYTPWFMRRRSEGFDIPSKGVSYGYQLVARQIVDDLFTLGDGELAILSDAENRILGLYLILFRAFNNLPCPLSAEWIRFGFCFCSNRKQKESLSKAYISLADSGATLTEIAHAWEEKSLLQLMENRGIDVSHIRDWGISMYSPPIAQFGIYRLVTEVTHALSGFYCWCLRPSCELHSKHEHILHKESEGDYGFTGTNAWERWQLLNFYNYVFSRPGFEPRQMQKARHDHDPQALERYLNILVPDFRRRIFNIYLADGMFPRLGTRISFPNGLPECDSSIHSVCLPDGLGVWEMDEG
ncbi:hypothetical protein CNMCM7691_002581 [Aspergillus felis]|uniref:MYND-type domain-containing protein n=1 Tax=Aspergillus felis TaxID=1287682 RepID=A0A8H6R2V5_9EURO|nr:hypothetical protein CNMCM7691_002581 [Aspergillus felis]